MPKAKARATTAKKAAPAKASASKPISKDVKKPATASSKAAKASAATTAKNTKKAPVAPKKKAIEKKSSKILDLCLVLDCTASMGMWIERSKDTLKQIIDTVKTENQGLTVKVAFVAYRDITDHNRFDTIDFTDDIDSVKKKI